MDGTATVTSKMGWKWDDMAIGGNIARVLDEVWWR